MAVQGLILNPGAGGGELAVLVDASSFNWPLGATAYSTNTGSPATMVAVTPTTGLPVRLADGSGYISTLPVSIAGTVTVAATDLDIRDLSSGTDSVSAVQSGTWNIGTVATITNPVTVTATNLDIRDLSSSTDSVAAVQSGAWTVQPGNTANTTAWLVTGTGGTFPVTDSGGSLTVDAPVGTPVFVRLSDGTNPITTLPVSIAGSVTVSGTVAATQSGAWNVSGTGAAGTAATGVMSVQGIASMTPVQVSQATAASLNATVVGTGTFAVQVSDALPAGTNNIGDVDVASIAAGTNYIGKVRITDGTTDNTILDLTNANPVTVAIVDGSGNQVTSFGGSGGTSSSFGSAFPSTGTAGGYSDGTNMQTARVFDADSGGGTQYVLGVNLRLAGSGGSVEAATASNPLRIDPTGTTTQPVGDAGGSLTVDNNGTFAVQAAQSGTWNVATVSTVTSVTQNADVRQATASNLNAQVVGNVAHDSAASGNPVRVAGYGSATAPSATSADGDVTNVWVDLNGRVQVGDGGSSLTVDGTVAFSNTTIAVTNTGTFAVQVDGAALTSLQLLDDAVATTGSAITAKGFAAVGTDGTDARILKTDTSGELQVDVLTLPAVTIAAAQTLATVTTVGTVTTITNPVTAVGAAAHDAVVSGNPVLMGGYASAAAPSVVATGDAVRAWHHTSGAAVVAGYDYSGTSSLPLSVNGSGQLLVAPGATFTVDGTVAATQSGTWNVGTVTTITNPVTAVGAAAHDEAVSGNPVLMGGYASTVLPTAVSADGDAVRSWMTRTGASVIAGHDGSTDQSIPIQVTDEGILFVQSASAFSAIASCIGNVASDSTDSGNPVKIGAKAETSLSTITLVADGDRTDLYAGVDGVLITRPHCNLEDIVTGNASNTDGTSTSCIASSGSGVKTYLTSVVLTNTSASNIYVEIKDGSTAKLTLPVPANGGVVFNPAVPIPGTAATAWNFDPSAATTTVYCSMVGFKSRV